MAAEVFDVLMVGDFRFPGGTSTCIAEQIRAQAKAGYRTGLIALKGPILRYPHAFNPDIRACIDDGLATLLMPDTAVETRLLLAFHPEVFTHPPAHRLNITAHTKRLVINHPPVDANGTPYYDWHAIDTNVQDTFGGDVVWAPVGPKVRAAFDGLERAPELSNEDWMEVIDAEKWQTSRSSFIGSRPVIGRHSRPDPQKWPDTQTEILAAYPDDNTVDVRILGAGEFLEERVTQMPANWTLLPFNAMDPKAFLATIDFYVYFHHSRWVEAFGRAIAEAVASGALTILPASFEPLFGDMALYAKPAEVGEIVRHYHANHDLFLQKTKLAQQLLQQKFGPQVHVERIRTLIGPPEPARIPAQPSNPRTALFFTSNGVGMGHLTRMLAIAKRTSPNVQPVFVTMSQAITVVKEAGYLTEFIPFHGYLRCDEQPWNYHLRRHLNEIMTFYQADTLVFDGNVAYEGLTDALADNPRCQAVWCRRGLWRPGAGPEGTIERESAFHMVLEPGEIAAADDVGLTTAFRERSRIVEPVRLLDADEMLDRDEAREALGLSLDGEAVLLQMGAGNNVDHSELRELLIERLLEREGIQIAAAEWLMARNELPLSDHVKRLRLFPLAKYLNAFDFVVSAAGYNSFHELIQAALPSIFVPNENPVMDEQITRAEYAEHHGLGLCLRAHDIYRAEQALASITDPEFRAELRARCQAESRPNGAVEAARVIDELAHTVRADRPLRDQRPVRIIVS